MISLDAARIKQLDERTIGFIAAGEVVERPAQVVKECVENSLDAGATMISVEIQRGGFDKIIIRDNGGGIVAEDLPKSLDRHATSKLQNESDLGTINTLGFRGEALASIGMVSHLIISSRPKESEGVSISMVDGVKGVVEPCGIPAGTVIEVRHLFRNQPARLAFQRRPASEASKIVDVLVQHALANSQTGFKLVSDERTLLDTPSANDLSERMYDLLGSQANRMLELKSPASDEDAPGEERWSGWISPPEVTRGKGDDVHVLINGRPIAAQPFLSAIRRGYKTRLMVGRHPVAVLHLTLPPNEVDVNVHPTKREVRLRHSWRVLERIERAIAFTLETVPTEPDAGGHIEGLQSLSHSRINSQTISADDDSLFTTTPTGALPNAANEVPEHLSHIRPIGSLSTPQLDSKTEKSSQPSWAKAATSQLSLSGEISQKEKNIPKPRPISRTQHSQQLLTNEENAPISAPLSSGERTLHRHSENDVGQRPTSEPQLSGRMNELPEMEPLSQFADSYILAQAGDELLLIDQHALHERVRYERLRHGEKSWESQERITPIPLNLNPIQSSRLHGQKDRLSEVGFAFIEDDAEGWMCTAAPAIVPKNKVVEFIQDLLQDLEDDEGPLETLERRMDHIAFLQSCRGAVKANEPLSLAEMRRLLEDMRHIPNPWACVHGRPTALRIPVDQLDHHFGRHG